MTPRILLRLLGISALLVSMFATAPARASADPGAALYKAAQDSYAKLRALPAEKRRFRHHWKDAISRFSAVAEKYPKSSRADDALYMVGKLYSELYEISVLGADADEAIAAFASCTSKYPQSNYADDCLVLRARLQMRRGKQKDAVAALRQVVTDYPKGDQVKEAQRLLAREGIKVTAVTTPAPTPTPAVVPPANKKKTSGGQASAESQAVNLVKHWSNPNYTQVAIYGGGPMSWTVNELPPDPEKDRDRRIYVDLKKAHIAEALRGNTELTIGDGLLQRARFSQFDPETVRVVLDVASMDDYTVIPMEDPFRVLVQVFGNKPETVAVAPGTAAPGPTPGLIITVPTPAAKDPKEKAREIQDATQKSEIPLFQQLGLKVGKIYVDAGHGGHDPGARGPTGLLEKEVTLKIAKRVAKNLEAAGYEAVLTREDDTYLTLEERSGKANEGKGDLFVSIHCNSTEGNRQVSGVETYFADTASDKAAERLAAIENATTTQKMSELEHILEGLLRGAFTPMSADLASSVQKELFATVHAVSKDTKDLKVKSALFYVLLTAQMPAILVETSFISNKADEKRLKDPKHLDRIAKSISDGIDQYLQSRYRMPIVSDPKKDAAQPRPEKAETGGDGGAESALKGKSKSTR